MRVTNLTLSLAPGPLRSFLHNRRQMPVGQGGLHIGALKLLDSSDLMECGLSTGVEAFGQAEVRYIYDCGSVPKHQVDDAVKTLRSACPDRSLDLLFLSHFDCDHMNGIPRLLRKSDGFHVDTIVLPYVDMAERVAALAGAFSQAQAFGGRIDGFFKNMVFDPVGTLAEFRPRRIIFILPDDGEGPASGGAEPVMPPESGPSWEFERERRGTRLLLKPAFPDDLSRPMKISALPAATGSQQIVVKNAALIAHDDTWSILWKFLPYARAADPAVIAEFRSLVEDLFGWPQGEFDLHIAKPAVRKKMVTKFRTKMGAIYKTAFGDKNLGSMSLYSGPADPASLNAIAAKPALGHHSLTKIGWIGTGDAHLEESVERTSFINFYLSDIDHASSFVLPHHGSITNSDPDELVGLPDHFVVAADPVHDWKHPHWLLEKAAESMGAAFKHVRRWPATGFDECFIVSPTKQV